MKQFTVVRLPKCEEPRNTLPVDSPVYNTYDEAVAAMNLILQAEERHLVNRPRFEAPLRVELTSSWLELWIADRPEQHQSNVIPTPQGPDFRKIWHDRLERQRGGLDDAVYCIVVALAGIGLLFI